jgi:hypothetical protein
MWYSILIHPGFLGLLVLVQSIALCCSYGAISVILLYQLLTCLMVCLNSDQHCYSIWRQLYTKHLPQSAVLLDHIGMYAYTGVLKIFSTVTGKTTAGVLRTIHYLLHIVQFKYCPTNVIISGMIRHIYL